MGVQIRGFDAERSAALTTAGERVGSYLDFDGELSIGVQAWPPMPEASVARADPGRITFNSRYRNEDPFRLQIVLYEEVAHHVATERGLPTGRGTASFLQELFGMYVMIQMIRAHNPERLGKMNFLPIDPRGGGLGYTLGSHLGAELAGSQVSSAQLSEWLKANASDYGAGLVTEMWQRLSGFDGPADLLERLLAYWDGIDTPVDF